MEGNLLKNVIGLTGLPETGVENWMTLEAKRRGMDPASLDIEQLRILLTDILQDMILQNEKLHEEN